MNIPYVIYDPATGEILQSGDCLEQDLAATVQDRTHLVGFGDRSTHYVVGDTIHLYDEQQRDAKAVPPPGPYRWSNATMSYEPFALS